MILLLSEGTFVGILVPDKTIAGKECLLLMWESLAHFTLMNSWYKRLHHCLRSYDNWFSISVDVSAKTCFCQTHVYTMSCQEGVDVPSLRILHTNQAPITNLWTWGSYLLETYWHGQLFFGLFMYYVKFMPIYQSPCSLQEKLYSLVDRISHARSWSGPPFAVVLLPYFI